MEYLDGLLKVGSQVPSCGCRCHSLAKSCCPHFELRGQRSSSLASCRLERGRMRAVALRHLCWDDFCAWPGARRSPCREHLLQGAKRACFVEERCVYIYVHHMVDLMFCLYITVKNIANDLNQTCKHLPPTERLDLRLNGTDMCDLGGGHWNRWQAPSTTGATGPWALLRPVWRRSQCQAELLQVLEGLDDKKS